MNLFIFILLYMQETCICFVKTWNNLKKQNTNKTELHTYGIYMVLMFIKPIAVKLKQQNSKQQLGG